ncbi:MAG: hypothetical protein LBS44_03735 [Deltaproteobacteria bacterium]|jgi:uncharacterized Zn finger protein|nr:hypothetical protein [Deltaproteobacteria bacterium]
MTFTDKDYAILEDWFLKQTKEELVKYLVSFCRLDDQSTDSFLTRINLEAGNVSELMSDIKKLTKASINYDVTRNYGRDRSRYGFTPDYYELMEKMEQALPFGVGDELLKLIEQILKASPKQIESYDHDGEMTLQVQRCYETAVIVLRASSLAPADKLRWAITNILDDYYNIGQTLAEYLEEDQPTDSWSKVADELLILLNKDRHLYKDSKLEKLRDMIIFALNKSDRSDDIMHFLQTEAEINKSYLYSVQQFFKLGRLDQAEKYINLGLADTNAATNNSYPYKGTSLSKLQLQLYSERKQWDIILKINVIDFVEEPNVNSYTVVEKTASLLNSWPQVRRLLLDYLESGNIPWQQPAWNWPKPDQIELSRISKEDNSFPMADILFFIAIMEKEPQDVLSWYEQSKQYIQENRPNRSHGYLVYDREEERELQVAEIVVHLAPELSLSIWKNKAERVMAELKPTTYEFAIMYLKKVKEVMINELHQQTEWEDYVKKIRTNNLGKKKFIKILDEI